MVPIATAGAVCRPHLARAASYRLRIHWPGGVTQVTEDPYSFGLLLGELDVYLLAEGNHLELGRCLGAQAMSIAGIAACASRSGRPMRGASRWSATSTAGMAGATRCASASRPVSGSCSFRGCPSAPSTNTRSSARTDCCRSRPIRSRCRRKLRRARPRWWPIRHRLCWSDEPWLQARAGTGQHLHQRRSRSMKCTPARGGAPDRIGAG
jgi:hypothetical protein